MKINLHIERLILDGLPLTPGQGPSVQAAVEAHLARLLKAGGVSPTLLSGGALSEIGPAKISFSPNLSAGRLGERIAGAVHERIGNGVKR